jgi:ankyrin repeat protein
VLSLLSLEINTISMAQYGHTALNGAAINGHLDVVRFLIEECGVDASAKFKVSKFG